MSNTFPDAVLGAKTLYHKAYGSHDGGYDPGEGRWQYWKLCYGYNRPRRLHQLIGIKQTEARGLRPCPKCFR